MSGIVLRLKVCGQTRCSCLRGMLSEEDDPWSHDTSWLSSLNAEAPFLPCFLQHRGHFISSKFLKQLTNIVSCKHDSNKRTGASVGDYFHLRINTRHQRCTGDPLKTNMSRRATAPGSVHGRRRAFRGIDDKKRNRRVPAASL